MNRRVQVLCVWSGLIFIPLFLLRFGVVAQFIPPPAPGNDAREVAQLFAEDRNRIRLGMWITMGASALMLGFFAVISVQLRRTEGQRAPMATLQAIAGGLAVLELIFPLFFWQAAAYRGNRSAEATSNASSHDGRIHSAHERRGLVVVHWAHLHLRRSAVRDRGSRLRRYREDPVFPRWSAYLNIWAALGVAPGCLVVFVDDGPFAWDGLVFWLLVISFLIWIVIMAVLLFRAIKHDESSSSDSAGRPPVEAGT